MPLLMSVLPESVIRRDVLTLISVVSSQSSSESSSKSVRLWRLSGSCWLPPTLQVAAGSQAREASPIYGLKVLLSISFSSIQTDDVSQLYLLPPPRCRSQFPRQTLSLTFPSHLNVLQSHTAAGDTARMQTHPPRARTTSPILGQSA